MFKNFCKWRNYQNLHSIEDFQSNFFISLKILKI